MLFAASVVRSMIRPRAHWPVLPASLFVHWARVWPWGMVAMVGLMVLRPEPALYWVESWHYAPLRDPVRALVVDWISSPVGQAAMQSERWLRSQVGLPNESMPSVFNQSVSLDPVPHVSNAPIASRSIGPQHIENSIAAHADQKSGKSCFNKPKKVLLVGDSMMQGLTPWLQRQFKSWGAHTLDHSKHSTGLVNKVYYNWPEKLADLMMQHSPDMVMVMLGANDHLDMVIEGKQYARYRSEAWRIRYSERVRQMAQAALDQGAWVVWIGLPAMREPWYEDIAKVSTPLFEQEMRALGMLFVDARPVLLEPSETYSHYLSQGERKVLIRASDGIHLAPAGSQVLVQAIMERLNVCPTPQP